jgi:hypothetical protein
VNGKIRVKSQPMPTANPNTRAMLMMANIRITNSELIVVNIYQCFQILIGFEAVKFFQVYHNPAGKPKKIVDGSSFLLLRSCYGCVKSSLNIGKPSGQAR